MGGAEVVWQAAGGLEVVRGRQQVGRSCGWGRFPCASLPTVLCLSMSGCGLCVGEVRMRLGFVLLVLVRVWFGLRALCRSRFSVNLLIRVWFDGLFFCVVGFCLMFMSY